VIQPKKTMPTWIATAVTAVLTVGLLAALPSTAAMGAGQAHTIEVAANEQLDAAAVEAALAQGDVVVRFEDPGEVVFNSTLAWSSGHALAIEAPGTLMVDAGASINAPGAQVSLEAPYLALLDGSAIDVSATNTPGAIYVGGGWQGANPALRNATAVYVAPGATLKADATASGQGGTVVCWADGVMNFHGAISARGVAAGGTAEVSGQRLSYTGLADLGAGHGPAGTLLLDPDNIVISNAPTSGVTHNGTGLFTAPDGDSNLSVTDLTDQLDLSAVQVQTSVGGDITVEDTIAWTEANSLALTSSNNIVINAGISSTGADLDLDAAGVVTVAFGVEIKAQTLNVTNGSASSIDGVIAGITTLAANGPGKLTLTGANTYAGSTQVTGGTLALSGSGWVGMSSSVGLMNAGATFDVSAISPGASTLVQNLAGVDGTTVILGGVNLAIGSVTNTTFAGVIQGTGSLTKTSGATLTLPGANTYTGSTTITQGGLTLGAAYTVATGATMTVYAGATLTNNAVLLVSGSLTNSGTVNNTTGLIVVAPGATTTGFDQLTFDANGGFDTYTYAEPTTGTTTFDLDKLTTFGTNPVRSGYALLGWADQATGGLPVTSPHPFTNGDIVYAQWGELPTITTTSLPDGNVGTSYSQTLAATGDTPITWSLDSGTLPAGLTLSADGVISGTPTTTGTSTFTVMATNTNGDDTATLTITISPRVYQVILPPLPGSNPATASPTTAMAGITINLKANTPPGASFVRWSVSPAVTWISGSATSEQAAFIMPASDVTVVPLFDSLFGPPNATINPTAANFDVNKAAKSFGDLMVTLSPGGYQLEGIYWGSYQLQVGKDYTVSPYPTTTSWDAQAVSASVYTFLKEFLASLPVGTHTITFVMSGGVNPELTLTITDSRPVSPVPITGDTTNPQGWTIALWSTLIGAFVMLLWRRRRQLRGTW